MYILVQYIYNTYLRRYLPLFLIQKIKIQILPLYIVKKGRERIFAINIGGDISIYDSIMW